MRQMCLVALYSKLNLSRHKQARWVYPYLLKRLDNDKANLALAGDITYIPMAKGFVLSGCHFRGALAQGAVLASFEHA
jgi:putative transposase